MGKLKSAIILKDRIFIPDYDSYPDMLEELGINDCFGASEVVKAELYPVDNDVFSNIDNWKFTVNQEITPDWYSEKKYKPKMVKAVKEWAKAHIHIGTIGLKIENEKNHYIKDCKNVEIINSTVNVRGNSIVTIWGDSAGTVWGTSLVTAMDNSIVKARGNSTVKAKDNSAVKAMDTSTVEAWGNSTVTAMNNSTVTAMENSTVEAWGNSIVKARGNSTVKAKDNSIVEAWGNSTVEAWGDATVTNNPYWTWHEQKNLILADNATFKDKISKVIYQTGDYKLISVENGKKIGELK